MFQAFVFSSLKCLEHDNSLSLNHSPTTGCGAPHHVNGIPKTRPFHSLTAKWLDCNTHPPLNGDYAPRSQFLNHGVTRKSIHKMASIRLAYREMA